MKKLIMLLLLISSITNIKAQDYKAEIVTGGYIYHLCSKSNVNTIGQETTKLKQSLTSPMFGIKYSTEYLHQYSSFAIFYTENEIRKALTLNH